MQTHGSAEETADSQNELSFQTDVNEASEESFSEEDKHEKSESEGL